MKLTPRQLKRIIAEEVNRVLSEGPYDRRGVGSSFRSPQGRLGNTGYRERGFEGGAPAQLVRDPMGTQPAPLPPPPQPPAPGVKKTYQLGTVENLGAAGCNLNVFSYEGGEKVTRVVPLSKQQCDQLVNKIKKIGSDRRASKEIAQAINPYLEALEGTMSGMADLYGKFKQVGLVQ